MKWFQDGSPASRLNRKGRIILITGAAWAILGAIGSLYYGLPAMFPALVAAGFYWMGWASTDPRLQAPGGQA